ncbi:MAG: PAS domain-containing sensor histidine kinase [Alphaproteobacteria bacterium]|nr:PAS domain-containing sensor histidine kinase [Alphaproteobacteria bacterium]
MPEGILDKKTVAATQSSSVTFFSRERLLATLQAVVHSLTDFAPFILHRYYRRRRSSAPTAPRPFWQRALIPVLAILITVLGLATYAAFNEMPPFGKDPKNVLWVLNIDLVALLLLLALVAQRVVALWLSRRRGLAGSHLHVRLVYIFSLLAAVPAIIMTVFAALFFHFGVQAWFSERVRTAVFESQAVAESYLAEHKQVIRADILAMANDLDRQAALLVSNDEAFSRVLQTQSVLRNLSEVVVFDSRGNVLSRSGLTFSLEFDLVPDYALTQAREGDVVVMTGTQDDRVRALVKLANFSDAYLFVGRMVDPDVLSHLSATKEASEDYQSLENKITDLQLSVTLIFIVVGLLLLSSATWFGLILARQLVSPIGTLVSAVERVRLGELTVRVPEESGLPEFDTLARAFNRMTRQIAEQQGALLEANQQIDDRRRLIESVLTGVSSGVIGVDTAGVINLANASASALLHHAKADLSGKQLRDIIPEFLPLLEQAHEKPQRMLQADIAYHREGSPRQILLVRIVIERLGDQEAGAIITFDDITDLQSAQRKAAWADVARRIAHEIKNPLTPIQLSAERLRRKYLEQIKTDPEIFAQCTETIVKNVEDIGRMVNEFSAFARMPEPVMAWEMLGQTIDETLFLQRQAHPDVQFDFQRPQGKDIAARIDARQIRQALTNLLQNALDSIQMRREVQPSDQTPARIQIIAGARDPDMLYIAVSDNGLGFPPSVDTKHLVEPYVTHKPKGTGLGLAIVKKIMEDHNGDVMMGAPDWLRTQTSWTDLRGATIVLLLPRQYQEAAA